MFDNDDVVYWKYFVDTVISNVFEVLYVLLAVVLSVVIDTFVFPLAMFSWVLIHMVPGLIIPIGFFLDEGCVRYYSFCSTGLHGGTGKITEKYGYQYYSRDNPWYLKEEEGS